MLTKREKWGFGALAAAIGLFIWSKSKASALAPAAAALPASSSVFKTYVVMAHPGSTMANPAGDITQSYEATFQFSTMPDAVAYISGVYGLTDPTVYGAEGTPYITTL